MQHTSKESNYPIAALHSRVSFFFFSPPFFLSVRCAARTRYTFRSPRRLSHCVRWWPLLPPGRHPDWLDSTVWRSCCWPSTWTPFHLKVGRKLNNRPPRSSFSHHYVRRSVWNFPSVFIHQRVIGSAKVRLLFRNILWRTTTTTKKKGLAPGICLR